MSIDQKLRDAVRAEGEANEFSASLPRNWWGPEADRQYEIAREMRAKANRLLSEAWAELKAQRALAPDSTRTGDEGTEDGWRIVRSVMRRLAAAKNAGGVEDPETCAQVLGDAVDAGITMCREALATHPAAPEAQGAWRPIESGPTDGSEVLVFCIDTNEQFVAYQRDGDWHYAYYEPTKTRIVCDPDFWRPLPAPPAYSGQEG